VPGCSPCTAFCAGAVGGTNLVSCPLASSLKYSQRTPRERSLAFNLTRKLAATDTVVFITSLPTLLTKTALAGAERARQCRRHRRWSACWRSNVSIKSYPPRLVKDGAVTTSLGFGKLLPIGLHVLMNKSGTEGRCSLRTSITDHTTDAVTTGTG